MSNKIIGGFFCIECGSGVHIYEGETPPERCISHERDYQESIQGKALKNAALDAGNSVSFYKTQAEIDINTEK